jgi:glutathione S-transferase
MTTPRLWSFRSSPYSGKARAAFAEKGVELELVEIHPARRPARLKELNVAGRVPVLELDDGAIRESLYICEWLEETHPEPPLWPADPALRGWARGWAKWLDETIVADYFLGMRKWAFGKSEDDPEDIVEQLHARLARRWPTLEQALGVHDGPWLTGGQFTYADLSGMPAAVRIPEWTAHLVPDAATYPLVTAWMAALRDRPTAVEIDTGGETVLEA